MQQEVASPYYKTSHQDPWPWTLCVYQNTGRYSSGIHSHVPKCTLPSLSQHSRLPAATYNQVALSCRELHSFSKLRRPR